LPRVPGRAGGFVGFVPLPYQPENNEIRKNPADWLRHAAHDCGDRIYLDNFHHVTAYWVAWERKLAQVA